MAKTDDILKIEVPTLQVSDQIENLIFDLRNKQVMLDRDLAALYGVETKRLNEQVKRNIDRFPDHFRFQLTDGETNELVANCDRLHNLKHSTVNPFVFTEQGVAMLSTVLRSDTAVNTSIRIIDAFVAMRHFAVSNAQIFRRLEVMEHNQLVITAHLSDTDSKIEEVFRRLDNENAKPQQGIFYDGEIFDAYTFVCQLVRIAQNRIVLIDNYIDETVFSMLDKRADGVSATIFTKTVDKHLQIDIARHNAQYPPVNVEVFAKSHDRFLCIDDTVYHIGASIKDLGKKWFAFNRMELTTDDLLLKIQQ